MFVNRSKLTSILGAALMLAALATSARAATPPTDASAQEAPPVQAAPGSLATDMKVGDVVFIRVGARPFREVAAATDSWTNHVGVVVDVSGAEPLIGESTFPLSRTTTLSRFVARSEGGRVSVARLKTELTPGQRQQVFAAAEQRAGIFYDTGFNLHSRRQFCSRYVREVLVEATGTTLGEVETFAHLLSRKPDTRLGFWRVWYFGQIPWNRETVTPASVLRSPELRTVFDGSVAIAETPDR